MGSGIFLIGSDDQLVELTPQPYESEDLLQRLLESYPSVLAGDQFDPSTPRRWLLVSREVAVPGELGGAGRWSLDHLFLDQDAIPTLVEVKRSTDTRIRREVIGQMMDYAANAVAYWPVEALQAAFVSRCTRSSLDAQCVLSDFLDGNSDAATFWQTAKTNLQAGRIRLVFVADEIPAELRRIIEFLNEQMDPAEVLAVEIQQYVGGGLRSLVPRLIGQTEQAKQRKTPGNSVAVAWDEESILAEVRARNSEAEAAVAGEILEWAKSRGARLSFGKGQRSGSAFVVFDNDGIATWPIAVWTYGKVELQFQFLRNTPAFRPLEARRELQHRLNAIPFVAISEESLERRPSIPLATLQDPGARREFLDVLDWVARSARDGVQSS